MTLRLELGNIRFARQTPLPETERAARAEGLPRKVVSIGNLARNLHNLAGAGEGHQARLAFMSNVLALAIGRYLCYVKPESGQIFIQNVRRETPACIVSRPLGSLESVDMAATLRCCAEGHGWQAAALAEIADQEIPAYLVAEAVETVAFSFTAGDIIGAAHQSGPGSMLDGLKQREQLQKQVLGPYWFDEISDWLEQLAKEPA
jgi:hypothetical protein